MTDINPVKNPKCYSCRGKLIILVDEVPFVVFRCKACRMTWTGTMTEHLDRQFDAAISRRKVHHMTVIQAPTGNIVVRTEKDKFLTPLDKFFVGSTKKSKKREASQL